MNHSQDWVKFILDLPMRAQPGAVTSYCTGGVVVLGAASAQRAGMGLDRYADTWLFGPLNVHAVEWRRSPDGSATGGGGLKLRPRDAAKLGALFANEGVWNGTRVVPESWVRDTRLSPVAFGSLGYGLLWWKTTFQYHGQPLESVFTSGNGGNFIFYIPTQELVVVFTGSNYNDARSDTPLQIMPLVVSALP